MTDPIADILNRIKNAQAAGKETVEFPFSKMNYAIAKILEEHGFIKHGELRGRKSRKVIELLLQYKDKIPAIRGVRRISKPGQRIYVPAHKIPNPRRSRGIVILSTPKGLMTGQKARKEKLGGEVICELWG